MMRSVGFAVAAAVLLASVSTAHAADPVNQPDLVSLGLGYNDFDKSESHKQSADFRGEYRWGLSMLPLISSYFNSWDPYVQFHPMVGVETTTWGQLYGAGGWAMDGYVGRHGIITWSENVGFFYPGDAFRLGSFVEFRSMIEAGWRFDNEMRLTGELSHISNAGLTKRNPGEEIAGIYLHVPVGLIVGSGK